MARNAIGLIELTSIAAGFEVTDTMLKAADVELLIARTTCPGKYLVIIGGDAAAVTASVRAGVEIGTGFVVNECIIPNVHEDVFPAFSGETTTFEELEALGVLESFSIATLIRAADATVKTANVKLIQIGIAMAIGGKAYLTLTGDVGSVRTAVNAGADIIAEEGMLVNKAVIPAPVWTAYFDSQGVARTHYKSDIEW